MFLSKKLLIDQWAPTVVESFTSKESQAGSSTRLSAGVKAITTNNVFYQQGAYVRKVNIGEEATSQTNVISNGVYLEKYSHGDSTQNTRVFYGTTQSSSDIVFYKLVINTETNASTVTTQTKTWSHTSVSSYGQIGDNLLWENQTSSSGGLYYNNTQILSGAGGSYIGKPNANTVSLVYSSSIYNVIDGTPTLIGSFQSGTSIDYKNGYYYAQLTTSPTYTLRGLTNAMTTTWETPIYMDEEGTVATFGRALGVYGDRIYVAVTSSTDLTITDPNYKLVLKEISLATGDILHSYDLPLPKAVVNGLITLRQTIQGNAPLRSPIECSTRTFPFPILVGYTANHIFYHDWLYITIPE